MKVNMNTSVKKHVDLEVGDEKRLHIYLQKSTKCSKLFTGVKFVLCLELVLLVAWLSFMAVDSYIQHLQNTGPMEDYEFPGSQTEIEDISDFETTTAHLTEVNTTEVIEEDDNWRLNDDTLIVLDKTPFIINEPRAPMEWPSLLIEENIKEDEKTMETADKSVEKTLSLDADSNPSAKDTTSWVIEEPDGSLLIPFRAESPFAGKNVREDEETMEKAVESVEKLLSLQASIMRDLFRIENSPNNENPSAAEPQPIPSLMESPIVEGSIKEDEEKMEKADESVEKILSLFDLFRIENSSNKEIPSDSNPSAEVETIWAVEEPAERLPIPSVTESPIVEESFKEDEEKLENDDKSVEKILSLFDLFRSESNPSVEDKTPFVVDEPAELLPIPSLTESPVVEENVKEDAEKFENTDKLIEQTFPLHHLFMTEDSFERWSDYDPSEEDYEQEMFQSPRDCANDEIWSTVQPDGQYGFEGRCITKKLYSEYVLSSYPWLRDVLDPEPETPEPSEYADYM